MTCNTDTVQQYVTIDMVQKPATWTRFNSLQHGHGLSTYNYRHGSTTFNMDTVQQPATWARSIYLQLQTWFNNLQHGHGSTACNMGTVHLPATTDMVQQTATTYMVQQPIVWIRFNNMLHGRGSLKQQLATWTQFHELNANKTEFLIIGTNVQPEFYTGRLSTEIRNHL